MWRAQSQNWKWQTQLKPLKLIEEVSWMSLEVERWERLDILNKALLYFPVSIKIPLTTISPSMFLHILYILNCTETNLCTLTLTQCLFDPLFLTSSGEQKCFLCNLIGNIQLDFKNVVSTSSKSVQVSMLMFFWVLVPCRLMLWSGDSLFLQNNRISWWHMTIFRRTSY